ncbi:hypothetical protein H920_04093 [Fukomys damarensis]|uniref:Uncharacterized protein n=1 Tax=Fukomys damarensis TaxID=885580 RepID=A0A091DQV2_FUKDA|nr:hypothetical protein H920_04093 [Fukomys damarensis]
MEKRSSGQQLRMVNGTSAPFSDPGALGCILRGVWSEQVALKELVPLGAANPEQFHGLAAQTRSNRRRSAVPGSAWKKTDRNPRKLLEELQEAAKVGYEPRDPELTGVPGSCGEA